MTDKYSNLRGEMHKLFEELELSQDSIEFKALHGQIWATWNDVEIHLKK